MNIKNNNIILTIALNCVLTNLIKGSLGYASLGVSSWYKLFYKTETNGMQDMIDERKMKQKFCSI